MANSFKLLKDIGEKQLSGKRVLLRLDLNVPIANGVVTDDYRIVQSLPTINFLREKGAIIIVIAHLESKEKLSLEVVANHMNKYFSTLFVSNPFSKEGKILLEKSSPFDVTIIENLRNWSGEKDNDESFAKQLADMGEIYVNEAFSVSHRAHASIVGVPKFLPGFAGLNFQKEVENLSKAFTPQHPYVFILGGAKFETKAPLITKFLDLADTVFVGGALANDLLKAKGYNVAESVVSDKDFGFKEMLSNPKLMIPSDVVVQNGESRITTTVNNVVGEEKIWDAGPETSKALREKIQQAQFILWNGPLGMYEENYKEATLDLAKAISESGATSIVGGGDTLASIAELGLAEKFTFISTAGGAMLDFLANETLVGIEALEQSNN